MEWYFILGIILGITLIIISTTWFKGLFGEFKIKVLLGKNKPGKKRVVNDFIIKTKNNSSTQIDHVLICDKGVYVIETKNYSGMMYGTKEDKYWTQVLAGGKVKNKLYNPLKQNYGHIYNLREYVPHVYFNSCVIFLGTNIKNVHAENVYTAFGFLRFLKKEPVRLNSKKIEEIYKQINDLKIHQTISKKEHLENIKKYQQD